MIGIRMLYEGLVLRRVNLEGGVWDGSRSET